MCNIAAPAGDSLQYSLQLVAIHNDNKQNVLSNKFTCDQAQTCKDKQLSVQSSRKKLPVN